MQNLRVRRIKKRNVNENTRFNENEQKSEKEPLDTKKKGKNLANRWQSVSLHY